MKVETDTQIDTLRTLSVVRIFSFDIDTSIRDCKRIPEQFVILILKIVLNLDFGYLFFFFFFSLPGA